MVPFRFSNRTVAVAIALVAAGYLALALRMPEFTAVEVPVQPATLPRLLGAALLLLAAVLFFQRPAPAEQAQDASDAVEDSAEPSSPGTAEEGTEAGDGAPAGPQRLGRLSDPRLELLLFAGSVAGYITLLVPLGFLITTALYIGATTWYLGYRRHAVNAAVSVGVAALVYFGMSEGLNVVLPSGPFPF
ncbi:tripartite tricarboxylate transporter TctB family protein [Allosalinactinospora lopnorensis]|uniref:tripartite tricarboxylate transporter TctB family protein n=1 Tax=Allosalinactinospora lopnorensis TaxID=1352348 RepID=UPI000623BCDF|nr:tripartite tricarboxylate transporter TctB family protein [Allosalinactinospora lopnorensis]